MRRFAVQSYFVLGLALGALVGLQAGPAIAHSSYVGWTWHGGVGDPNWYLDTDFPSPLNTSTAQTSIKAGDDPWNAISGSNLDFIYSGTYSSQYLSNACNVSLPAGGEVLVSHGYLSGTLVGVVSRCVTSSTIFKAVVALDRDTAWYTGSSTSVPSGSNDLRSAIIHEFGHVAGYTAHFTNSNNPGACEGDNTQWTMCDSLPSGTYGMRTLETHDKDGIAAKY